MKVFSSFLWIYSTLQSHFNSHSELPYYGLSPPVYPSPQGPGITYKWSSAYTKARLFVNQLTLEEKLNLTRGYTSAEGGGNCVGNTGGIPRLNFRPLCLQDGPSGVRGADFVSGFPSGIHLAATFDRELMYKHGRALGEEFYGKGVNIALGPCSGPMGRIVRGGRNWEGYGPDPYLAGVAMGEVTKGMQDAGVIANPKHFLLNEQEHRRREGPEGEAISSNVDDTTLHELYLWPFMDALRAGAGSVMCSYQRANHSYACQNSKLLNGILKTELGFEGFVVSDWRAQHSGVASVHAGLDMVMPDKGFWGDKLHEAVTNGSVPIGRLDDMVTRVMAAFFLVGQDKSMPEVSIYPEGEPHTPVDVQKHHAKIIRDVAVAGHVLLKNEKRDWEHPENPPVPVLPLKSPKYVSIFGYDAEVQPVWGPSDSFPGRYPANFGWETFNGTLTTGGGSGANSPAHVISPFKAIQDKVAKHKGMLRWDFFNEEPLVDPNSEVCLVFINAYAAEWFDRTTLADPSSDRLVRNVADQCANTMVVVHSAGIRVVDEWIEHPNVTALIFAGLPGQESGNALVDILYGHVSPSGRLPYTIAQQEEDYGKLLNSTRGEGWFPEDNFDEGLNIDMAGFLKSHTHPRFFFGYGLSYSTFTYGPLKGIQHREERAPEFPPKAPIVQGGLPALWEVLQTLKLNVTNTGTMPAAEVVQIYSLVPGRPFRLRGFQKVFLEIGETKEVQFHLTRRDASVWDPERQQWKLPRGRQAFWAGSSGNTADFKVTTTLEL